MVTTFYPPYHFGGDAIYIQRLTHELARRGHHVDVIHDRDSYHLAHPGEPPGPAPTVPNVVVHGLKSGVGLLSPLATHQTGLPWFKPTLKRLLETQPYDVVHFHNASLIGPGAFRYGRAIKLYTMHEHWLLCPLHILWKFDREPCESKQCIPCTIHGWRPPQLWRYTDFLPRQLRHIDAFISPSRFTRDRHLKEGFEHPIDVLPYFLPRESAANAATTPAARHDRPYFLFVGRLIKVKGAQTLFDTFRRYPAADLLIAGDGDYEGELRRMAADIPNVKFLGRLPHAELRSLYAGAIAAIMPSICYEVFGIVLIEAFAERTPVIARDLGGMAEVIHDSGGGFAYKTDAELQNAMTRLQQDPEERTRLGEKGYEAFVRLWSEGRHLQDYFAIIEAASARKRAVDQRGLPV